MVSWGQTSYTKHVQPNIFRGKGNKEWEGKRTEWGITPFNIEDGMRLIKYATVRIAFAKNNFETFIANNKAQETFIRGRFLCSATPFCCGMRMQEDWCNMPFSFMKMRNGSEKYSLALSLQRTHTRQPNWVWILEQKWQYGEQFRSRFHQI